MMGSDPTYYSLSIEQLEKSEWGEAPIDSTLMVQRCHALRTKALKSLSPDEIGLAIRQRIGIPFILDLALDIVRVNLLYEGEHYPGDVLAALIRLPEEEWNDRPQLKIEVDELRSRALEELENKDSAEWHEFAQSFKPKQ